MQNQKAQSRLLLTTQEFPENQTKIQRSQLQSKTSLLLLSQRLLNSQAYDNEQLQQPTENQHSKQQQEKNEFEASNQQNFHTNAYKNSKKNKTVDQFLLEHQQKKRDQKQLQQKQQQQQQLMDQSFKFVHQESNFSARIEQLMKDQKFDSNQKEYCKLLMPDQQKMGNNTNTSQFRSNCLTNMSTTISFSPNHSINSHKQKENLLGGFQTIECNKDTFMQHLFNFQVRNTSLEFKISEQKNKQLSPSFMRAQQILKKEKRKTFYAKAQKKTEFSNIQSFQLSITMWIKELSFVEFPEEENFYFTIEQKIEAMKSFQERFQQKN